MSVAHPFKQRAPQPWLRVKRKPVTSIPIDIRGTKTRHPCPTCGTHLLYHASGVPLDYECPSCRSGFIEDMLDHVDTND